MLAETPAVQSQLAAGKKRLHADAVLSEKSRSAWSPPGSATDIIAPATAYLKTACEHCAGRIEFPTGLAGHLVACPHCARLIRLVPPIPSLSSETTADLLKRIRRDSCYGSLRKTIAFLCGSLQTVAALSLGLGMVILFVPAALDGFFGISLNGAVLFLIGIFLSIGAAVIKRSLSLLIDIADAVLDASRRIANK